MKTRLLSLVIIVAVLTNGCAVLSSPHTFAVCKTADVATTAYALQHGAIEANPVMAGVIHAVGITGFVALSGLMIYGVYKLSQRPDMKLAVGAANVVTCAAAISNVHVIQGL